MTWTWRVYWVSIGLGLFGLCLWFNHRKYQDKSWAWKSLKASVDSLLTCLLAAFCPSLLIGYCALWAARQFKGDGLSKNIVLMSSSIVLGIIGGWFLEVLLLIGVFASDLVTGKLIFESPWRRYYQTAGLTR